MGHILKSTLNRMLGTMENKMLVLTAIYVKNWKDGAAILFLITFMLAMAFLVGSVATGVILWLFNVELTDTWKALGLIVVVPFYVGLSRDALKVF